MPNCSICYERFTSPISLPCGHVFCKECIRRTVDAIKSCSVQHFCPTCRTPYSVLTIDPGLVPPYLRPHILPSLRQVYFDDPAPTPVPTPVASGSTSASATPAQKPSPGDLGQAVADATALRMNCATWRRRAEVHAAANAGLLSFARAAKDHALRMRAERDTARNHCALLKRKLAELMPEFDSDEEEGRHEGAAAPAPRTGLPVFLTQCKPAVQYYDNPADMTESHFGPPLKRRKESPSDTAPPVADTTPPRVADTTYPRVSALLDPTSTGVSGSAPSARHALALRPR